MGPLTWQVANDTPLRRWFERRFPHVDAVAADPLGRLRAVVPRGRPDTLPPWRIGQAFDWRIRLGLAVPAVASQTTAYYGWSLVRDVIRFAPNELLGNGTTKADLRALRTRWEATPSCDPVRLLLDHARRHGAGSAGAARRDEIELARVSVALACYEACYRGGVRSADDPVVQLGAAPSLDELTALCPLPAADELVRLTAAARRGLAPLFPATRIETNPVFDACGIPADGDLIVDGVLVDFKTVSRAEVRREWLWQLLGYVLLDDGRSRLDSAGLYLARHAWLQRWPLDELVARLTGTSVTVPRLCAELRSVVKG